MKRSGIRTIAGCKSVQWKDLAYISIRMPSLKLPGLEEDLYGCGERGHEASCCERRGSIG